MALELIATPLGDAGDITLRAIEILKAADVVIGEERKEASTLLKALGIEGKRLELLNEHSKEEEVRELAVLCKTLRVALITDCGTPGFCDPGARLVAMCRSQGISSKPIPGASSLMCLLSVSGSDMRQFLFRGFLPAEREERRQALNELARELRPVILMDTPYRLGRLLSELAEVFPERRVLLGCDFTQSTETVIEAKASALPALVGERKAEFILALYPGATDEKFQARAPRERSASSAAKPRSAGPKKRKPQGGYRAGSNNDSRPGQSPAPKRKFTPGRRKP